MIRSTAPSLSGSPAGTSSTTCLPGTSAIRAGRASALRRSCSSRPAASASARRPIVHRDRGALRLHPGALDLVRRRQHRGDHVGGDRPGREPVGSDQPNARHVDEPFELVPCPTRDGRDHAIALDEARQHGPRSRRELRELRPFDDRAERSIHVEQDPRRPGALRRARRTSSSRDGRSDGEPIPRRHGSDASVGAVGTLATWTPSPRSRWRRRRGRRRHPAAPNTFPPIAEYAFIADLEVTALIAPSGNVEWLSVPRPDAPSVFGAILDRSAGTFRLGPAELFAPAGRRYIPGTNILETTWHTSTGWLVVRDALIVGPWSDDRRIRTYRRPPPDNVSEHVLVRELRCVNGRVDVQMSCEPVFDYGRNDATWEYSSAGYGEAVARGGGERSRPSPDDQHATGARGTLRARRPPDGGGRPRLRGALVERRRAAAHVRGCRRPDALHRELLARMAEPGRVPRSPVARHAPAERADAQGTHVRADRCAARGGHHVAPRVAGRRAELGLPLQLGARRHVRAVGLSTRSGSTTRPTASSISSPTRSATARRSRCCTRSTTAST